MFASESLVFFFYPGLELFHCEAMIPCGSVEDCSLDPMCFQVVVQIVVKDAKFTSVEKLFGTESFRSIFTIDYRHEIKMQVGLSISLDNDNVSLLIALPHWDGFARRCLLEPGCSIPVGFL